MVPDDEVGVTVVDLGQVTALVLVQVSPPPLNVAPASHQCRHRPLHGLGLPLTTAPSSPLLHPGQGPAHAGAPRPVGHPT